MEMKESTAATINRPAEQSNKEAERAIAIVADKLADTVDVEWTVNELIRLAKSEENLCQMYPGKRIACIP